MAKFMPYVWQKKEVFFYEKRLISLAMIGAMVVSLPVYASETSEENEHAEEEIVDEVATENREEEEEAQAADDESGLKTASVEIGNVPDVLNVGTTESLGSLQSYSNEADAGHGLYLIYDESFYYDNDDEMVSDIISDYYYSDDGFTIYLTLRDDIVFSNGDVATGEDFLYSFTSLKDPDRNALTTAFDRFDLDNAYLMDDGYTIAIPTDGSAKAYALLGNLVKVELVDKSWVEEVGWNTEIWDTAPVGSGPYEVSDYVFEYSYTYTLRDDYWNKDAEWYANLPQTINVYSYMEATTMFMDLETGAIDIAIEPESTDVENVVNGEYDDLGYAFIEGNCCSWMVFDCNGIFSDINLRKAVAHSVVWDDVAYAGKGIKYNPATSSIPYYFPDYLDVGQYEYDPDYAKECLAESGYDEDNRLTITMYIGPQGGTAASTTVLQEYLRLVGIDLVFEAYEMATVIPMWEAGEGDLSTYAPENSLSRDASIVYNDLSSNAAMAHNRTTFDSTIDDDLAKALMADSSEEAQEYYYDIQQWIYDNYRVVSYMEEVNVACFNTDIVKDVHFGSRIYPDLRFVEYAD